MTEVSFRVVIFDLSTVKVVVRCGEHYPVLAMIKDVWTCAWLCTSLMTIMCSRLDVVCLLVGNVV